MIGIIGEKNHTAHDHADAEDEPRPILYEEIQKISHLRKDFLSKKLYQLSSTKDNQWKKSKKVLFPYRIRKENLLIFLRATPVPFATA